jgi:hypothetical protein
MYLKGLNAFLVLESEVLLREFSVPERSVMLVSRRQRKTKTSYIEVHKAQCRPFVSGNDGIMLKDLSGIPTKQNIFHLSFVRIITLISAPSKGRFIYCI